MFSLGPLVLSTSSSHADGPYVNSGQVQSCPFICVGVSTATINFQAFFRPPGCSLPTSSPFFNCRMLPIVLAEGNQAFTLSFKAWTCNRCWRVVVTQHATTKFATPLPNAVETTIIFTTVGGKSEKSPEGMHRLLIFHHCLCCAARWLHLGVTAPSLQAARSIRCSFDVSTLPTSRRAL